MTKRNRSLRKMKKKSSRTSAHVSQEVSKQVPNGQMKSTELINTYLSEAEDKMNTFSYEEASEACQKVLELDPANLKALEMLASIHTENGNISEAKNIFMRCVELCPDDGFSKYFSLAQLTSGREAVDFYQKGIVIVQKQLQSLQSSEAASSSESSEISLHQVLSDAYCSIAELYMTDCCFEDDAENICKKSIESAIEADGKNPEAHQCLANFHLVKGETEESKIALNRSLSLWLPQYKAILDGEASANENFQPPSYDSRINTSKMLIELGLLDEANEVLEGLVAEDDEVIEVWYLLGWSNYLHGDIYKKNAIFYFQKAKEVHKKIGVADEDQMAHIEELLEEMADIQESGDSDVDEDDFLFESEESDTENCDVEMKQDVI